MQTLLGFIAGFALAGFIGGTASYRSGGELQFKLRLAQDIASRQPTEPSGADPGDVSALSVALMSGQAWRDFSARLEKAGEQILREDVPGDPRTCAEGFGFLAGLLQSALKLSMFADPDRPHFVRPLDRDAKWGLDNSDALYLSATIDGAQRYRITGTQAVVDSDGIVRLVVSAHDAGLANCVDTTGVSEGLMTYRWNGAKSCENPLTRPIHLDQLDREVPPHALRVSHAELTEQIAARRRAVQRRFQRG